MRLLFGLQQCFALQILDGNFKMESFAIECRQTRPAVLDHLVAPKLTVRP